MNNRHHWINHLWA